MNSWFYLASKFTIYAVKFSNFLNNLHSKDILAPPKHSAYSQEETAFVFFVQHQHSSTKTSITKYVSTNIINLILTPNKITFGEIRLKIMTK